MPKIPWLSSSSPVAGREYFATISYLPLRHFRALPSFFRFTGQIRNQLKTAKGLIGYSLDARPFGRKFWTLSVWEDQQSLMNFVGQLPHGEVMRALAPHMDKTQFAYWKVTAEQIPLDWRSAKARLGQS